MGLQAFVSVIRIVQGQGRHSMNMWRLCGLGGEVTGGCLGEMPSVEEQTGAGAVRCSVGGFALSCSSMDTWVGTGREVEQHLVFSGGQDSA